MELRIYLDILQRRKWIIALTTVAAIALALIGVQMMEPRYVTTATVRVAFAGDTAGYGDLLYAQRLMNTYPAIVTSGPMMAQLQEQLPINHLPEISVEFPAESELMQIVVEDNEPAMLAEVANTLAAMLITENKRSKAGRNFSISLIDPAVPPAAPSGPGAKTTTAVAAVLGLIGGVGLAFLFENLDTKLYSERQISSAARLPVLVQIPHIGKSSPVLNGNLPKAEAFRRLRTNIFASAPAGSLETLLVTSAEPKAGKSTTVANLALAVAQSKRKVIVVDTDFRCPNQHQIFDLANEVGLSDVLRRKQALDEAIQASEIPGVRVLTSGPLPANPTELLGSSEMTAVINQLTQRYDLVLLDTPALLPLIDAAVLAPLADGVLLVVNRDQTRQENLEAVCQQLAISKAKTIGVAVNRAGSDKHYTHYY
jgi:succinoglycan biosynthesis transport protein ExoP